MSARKQTLEVQQVEYADIIPDDKNANRGTVRGRFQIEGSIRQHGFLEAGTLDKNNRLIGGNKRTEIAHEIGLEAPLIIDIDGTRPIYLRRNNIDLDTPAGRSAALALNRSAQTSIDLDPEIVLAYQELGVDLDPHFFPEEVAEMQRQIAALAAMSAEITLPNPQLQKEIAPKAEAFIEIYCSKQDLSDFQSILGAWEKRSGVTVNIS